MGVFEKLKNALFEVEYVEEEDTKKEKKEKNKDSHKDSSLDENKPIAKKIVLPGKKEEKVEEIKEEDLMDEDFEVRPKDSLKPVDTFKYLDDDDFKVDEEPVIVEKIPQPQPVVDQTPVQPSFVQQPVEAMPTVSEKAIPSRVESNLSKVESNTSSFNNDYVREYDSYKQKVNVDDYKVSTPKESKPYGMDPSYQVSIKKYGSYENKDEKTYFKPSPIISPIYGILDKNYKKEDVVPKKSVRISNYSRSNVNVDDVRNKAFAEKGEEILEEEEPVKQLEVEEEDDNLLVDLNNEREKPEVKEITVGDAMEYFNDLGLEYNVDYVDVSNKKKKTTDLTDDIKNSMEPVAPVSDLTPKIISEEKPKEKETTPIVEVKNESSNPIEDDDDNLFDLIDSMYKEDK